MPPRGIRRVAVICACSVLLYILPVTEAKGAAARSAASSSGGAGASAGGASSGQSASVLVDNSPRALAASDAISNTSSAILGNLTFRCADVKTFRPGSNILRRNGNGFSRIDPTQVSSAGPVVSAALERLPVGGAYTSDRSLATNLTYLDGANPVFLAWMAGMGNFDVSVDFVNVPPQFLDTGDWTAIFNYVLNNLTYDCIISSVIVDAERTQEMTFLTAQQPYGYVVVAASAVSVPKTIKQVLFAWTDPFLPSIWGCTATCLVFTTVIMYFIEAKYNEDDFGLQEYNLITRLGRGLFHALCNFCAVGSFSPTTPAGQTFGIAFSFAMLLVQSAYTANLAAFFTRNKQNAQTITSIYSFPQLNLPVCVPRDLVLISLMSNNFPTVQIIPIDGGAFTVLDAIKNGTCAGAVMADADANHALGMGDVSGLYCSLTVTGVDLNTGFYGLAFNKNLNTSVIKALNDIVIVGLSLGIYGSLTANYFATDRATTCANYLAQQAQLQNNSDLIPLSFDQLAGIFFVLVIGAVASLFVYLAFEFAKKGKQLRMKAKGGSTVNDWTVDAEGAAAKNVVADLHADTDRYQAAKGGGGGAGISTFSGRIGAANPMLDFEPRPGEQPLQTTFRVLVSQIRDDVAKDMFRVPESLLHSTKRALAQGLSVRGRVEVLDGYGNVVGVVQVDGTTVGQMCMLHGLMTPEEAANFQRLVVALLRSAEANGNGIGNEYGRRPPVGSLPYTNGTHQQALQRPSFVDGLLATIGLSQPDMSRHLGNPPRGRRGEVDPYVRGASMNMPTGAGRTQSDKNLQKMAGSPMVAEPLRPIRQGTINASQYDVGYENGTGAGTGTGTGNGNGNGNGRAQRGPSFGVQGGSPRHG